MSKIIIIIDNKDNFVFVLSQFATKVYQIALVLHDTIQIRLLMKWTDILLRQIKNIRVAKKKSSEEEQNRKSSIITRRIHWYAINGNIRPL